MSEGRVSGCPELLWWEELPPSSSVAGNQVTTGRWDGAEGLHGWSHQPGSRALAEPEHRCGALCCLGAAALRACRCQHGTVPGAMGRLDDHAKRRIVELRRAGLSFRKIKKVLELDDIRVTPQAVYLFLKRKSVEPGSMAAGWDGDQPWPLQRGREAEPPEPPWARPPAMPSGDPASSQDSKEGIQIVSVTSLCKDGGQLGEALPVGLPSRNGKGWLPLGGHHHGHPLAVLGLILRHYSLSLAGNDGFTGTPSALGGPATPLQPLPSRGQLVTPPARNPAPMVKKKIVVDRAVLLQEKVGC